MTDVVDTLKPSPAQPKSSQPHGYEVPVSERERLGFGLPYRFELLDLPAGPRILPPWAQDARIDWHWGYSNRPSYLLRCRYNPLGFTKGPVWRLNFYDSKGTYDAGAASMGRLKEGRAWIAAQDGVALCHYHSGTIRMTEFEDNVTDEKGHIVWVEKPDYKAGKHGVPQTRKYSMLATDKQQGYGGSPFDITLAAQEIPIWDAALQRNVMTPVEEGTKLRLRGPWHGGAPKGYREVHYQYDSEPYTVTGRHQRKWHQRLGYYGLCIDPAILLDILTTYLPHVEWAKMTFADKDGDKVGWEPLHPETGLPDGWQLDPEDCQHDFMISNYSMGRRQAPSDDCRWCRAKRDPAWVPLDSRGEPMGWWKDRDQRLTFPRYPSLPLNGDGAL